MNDTYGLYLLPGGNLTLGRGHVQGEEKLEDELPEEADYNLVQLIQAPSREAAEFAAKVLRFREGSEDYLRVIWRGCTLALCYWEGDGSIERYDTLTGIL